MEEIDTETEKKSKLKSAKEIKYYFFVTYKNE